MEVGEKGNLHSAEKAVEIFKFQVSRPRILLHLLNQYTHTPTFCLLYIFYLRAAEGGNHHILNEFKRF